VKATELLKSSRAWLLGDWWTHGREFDRNGWTHEHASPHLGGPSLVIPVPLGWQERSRSLWPLLSIPSSPIIIGTRILSFTWLIFRFAIDRSLIKVQTNKIPSQSLGSSAGIILLDSRRGPRDSVYPTYGVPPRRPYWRRSKGQQESCSSNLGSSQQIPPTNLRRSTDQAETLIRQEEGRKQGFYPTTISNACHQCHDITIGLVSLYLSSSTMSLLWREQVLQV